MHDARRFWITTYLGPVTNQEPHEGAPLTWDDFCEAILYLVAQEHPQKEDLPLWAPHRLTHPHRNNLNVDHVSAIALDVEHVSDDEIHEAGSRLEQLGWAALIYESPSDGLHALPDGRPERRMRIVVPTDRDIKPSECKATRIALATLLGFDPEKHGITGETTDPARWFYAGRVAGTPGRDWGRSPGVFAPVDLLVENAPTTEPAPKTGAASGNGTPASDGKVAAIAALIRDEYATGRRHELDRAIGCWLAEQFESDATIEAVIRALPCELKNKKKRIAQAKEAAQQARDYRRKPDPSKKKPAGWSTLVERLGIERCNALQAIVGFKKTPPGGAAPAPEPQAVPIDPSAAHAGHDPAVDHVVMHLAVPGLRVFQRSGKLVTVTHDASDEGGVIRPAGTPTIRELTVPRLKEIIRMTAGPREANLASEVVARGEWNHIRPLDAIVSYPVMRRDGTLLTESGYDAATRTLAEITVTVDVPQAPTLDDARAALATLCDLVSDFPFADETQRAAWLAMLLTIPARPAIDGPTPLGLFEASMRSSGKSKLADVISNIATGRDAPRRVVPKTKEEWDKTMLSILSAGDPLVLFDNVTVMLASDALDAVLTGTTYEQRVLGVSEDRRVAIRTVFLASANNARLSTDLVRRSLGCRLDPAEEDPAQRTGFKHQDLLGHVREERSRYLSAALTVVRAYAVAGRPRVTTRPMGSYESWCRVVRDALVWAGAADPATTQEALRESADVERDEIGALFTAWHTLLGDKPVTVQEAIDATKRQPTALGFSGPPTEEQRALLDALWGVIPNASETRDPKATPTAKTLGNRLRVLRDQKVGGLVLRDQKPDRNGVKKWRVVPNV